MLVNLMMSYADSNQVNKRICYKMKLYIVSQALTLKNSYLFAIKSTRNAKNNVKITRTHATSYQTHASSGFSRKFYGK